MRYARKIDGQWQRWDGASSTFIKMVDEAVRHDGEVVKVEPYPLEVQLAATPALALYSNGELAELGLARLVPFVVPEGQHAIGEPIYVEEDGVVSEVYDTEPLPPPPELVQLTPAEKLAALGLTVDDIRALLAEDQV